MDNRLLKFIISRYSKSEYPIIKVIIAMLRTWLSAHRAIMEVFERLVLAQRRLDPPINNFRNSFIYVNGYAGLAMHTMGF